MSCLSPLPCCWLRPSRRHPALAANSADFTLKNQTGCQIDEVYVSTQSSKNWGKDVMGEDTLNVGDSVKITFLRNNRTCMRDIMVKYHTYMNAEWANVDLRIFGYHPLHGQEKQEHPRRRQIIQLTFPSPSGRGPG